MESELEKYYKEYEIIKAISKEQQEKKMSYIIV